MTILRMYHADLNAAGQCTQEAFDTVYSLRGWQIMEPLAATASDVLDRPVLKVSDLTIEEARRVIASVAVPQPPNSATKDEVLAVLTGAFDGTLVVDSEDTGGNGHTTNGPRDFDPSDYKVDEVVQYLAGADEAEVERVKGLEQAGQNRVTVLDWTPPGKSNRPNRP